MSTLRSTLTFAALTAAAVPATAVTVPISIENFSFVPANVDIQPGDTVVWTYNDSGARHNVHSTSIAEPFTSPDLRTVGETFSHTYTVPGTHPYECEFHASFMNGSVRVAAAATGACCNATGCSQTTSTGCSGMYRGDGTPCIPDPCAAPGCINCLVATKVVLDVVFAFRTPFTPQQLCKATLANPPGVPACTAFMGSDQGVVQSPPSLAYQVQ